MWLFCYMYFAFWQHLAENITFDLRSRYIEALLRQEAKYFEGLKVEAIPSQMGDTFEIMTRAIGQNTGNLVFSGFAGLTGIVIAFVRGPKLAAALSLSVPIFAIALGMLIGRVKTSAVVKMGAVKELGAITEESLSAIKVVVSFA